MNQNLKNKVALIFGATSGIGKATALAYAKLGASVVISGRREKEGNQVAALDYAKQGIRINTVSPAVIKTEMFDRFVSLSENPEQTAQHMEALHPIGRVGQPEEIANPVIFLNSSDAAFITGTDLIIDGGLTAK